MPKLTILVTTLILCGCLPTLQNNAGAAVLPISVEAGDLRFSPEHPRPGQPISVTYLPPRVRAAGQHLSLRARIRTPDSIEDDAIGSQTIAVLERQRDGSYRGTVSLPARSVYAAFAVEDVEATWSDTRAGRFWEVLMHEADARPAFAALDQRFNDHVGSNQLEMLHAAREMVRLYPDRVQSWSTLAQAEIWALNEDGAAERAAGHRARVRAFDRELAGVATLPADEVGHLFMYAVNVAEKEVAARWRSRLLAEHPGHFFAVPQRALQLHREHDGNPGQLLAELETLWAVASGARSRAVLTMVASGAAAATGDPEAILRWENRTAAVNSFMRASTAASLAASDLMREEGIRRLRSEITSLDTAPDEERPLGATMAEHRRASTRAAARLRASLGSALLAAGKQEEGIAALEDATVADWNVGWLRHLGHAKLAVGDRVGGIRALAAAAADPKTPAASGDSLRHLSELPPREWREIVDHARDEMIRRTLRTAQAGVLVDASAADREGNPVRLAEVLGDTATVIVVWSPYCPHSNRAMPAIVALTEELRQHGVPLLAVTDVSRASGEDYLNKGGWTLPVLYDRTGEVAVALNSSGTPQYFVVDGAGRLRFAFSSLDDIPRQVAALRAEKRGEH